MSTTVSATTDRISLIGLSARGHHGILPFKHEEGQLFTVGVVLGLGRRGTAVAAITDPVTDAVNYSRIASGTVSIIEREPVNLIKSLTDRITEQVPSFPRVVATEATVHKPEAPLDVAFEDVSVAIHWVADVAADHGGAPATSQATWATQAETPVTVSAQPYASPSSSVSLVTTASPAAPAYELPAAPAVPAAPIVSEVPDFSGASFTGGDATLAALASEAPITPTPSPASPMEASTHSSFAAAVPSVPTLMPTEPGTLGGSTESTQPWVPDWVTESADSSASSTPAWTPEASETPGAAGLPSGKSAVSYSTSGTPDAPSASAPTAASAGRAAGANGFVSLAAEALGAASASSKPGPSALSYAGEVVADAAATTPSGPAPTTDGLAVRLSHEGRHVTSSEEGEGQSAPVVGGSADLLGGPVAFGGSGSYSGAASNQISKGGDATPETAGADTSGFTFPALGGDATVSKTAGADGLMGASSVPAPQPLGESGPGPSVVPGELPKVADQEGVAPASSEPSYSQPSVFEDFSQSAKGLYAAPSMQSDFLGAPGAAPVPTAPEAPATPVAPVNPLSERPTRPVGVIFGLSANAGGIVNSLRTAVQSLKAAEGIEVTQVAPLAHIIAIAAESAGPQPDCLNTVVTAMTTLTPRELLEVCRTLKIAAGRVRTEPWGVRTLDVDLTEVGGVASSDPVLSLPYPRTAERVFVLVPRGQADPFIELAGRFMSEFVEDAPDRSGLRRLTFDWLNSESLPDRPIDPYVEPPVEQGAADSEPGLVYDATRDESSIANASLAADYTGNIAEASSTAPEPTPAQSLGNQGQVRPSPFGQLPLDTSNGTGSWAEQVPQVDLPYQATSAPEAVGPQGSCTSDLSAGPDGISRGQQDEAAGDVWKFPLQWNDVVGGGAQGTGPRRDV